jgi:hypothetical protein
VFFKKVLIMDYISATQVVIEKYHDANKLVDKLDDASYGKAVASRAVNIPFVPAFLVSGAIDTVVGVVSGLAAIPFSKSQDVWFFSMGHLNGSKKALANTYVCLMGTINPEGRPVKNTEFSRRFHNYFSGALDSPKISSRGDGFISSFVSGFFNDCAREYRSSEVFFMRHIASRVTHLAALPAKLIARVIDAAIAVFAVPAAIITYGKIESLNNLAYRTLQFTGIAQDFVFTAAKIFNPWAGVP